MKCNSFHCDEEQHKNGLCNLHLRRAKSVVKRNLATIEQIMEFVKTGECIEIEHPVEVEAIMRYGTYPFGRGPEKYLLDSVASFREERSWSIGQPEAPSPPPSTHEG